MKKIFFTLSLFAGLFISLSWKTRKLSPTSPYKEKLSEYGFFKGKISGQQPAENVMPYALNASLFSDYAYKLRFVRLPQNGFIPYNPDSVFQFPVGTAIIKTFYYPLDERNIKKGRRLIETRLLLHEQKGWVSLPYIWDDKQTDAKLEVAGGNTLVTWRDEKGQKREFEYLIPNMNQCKGCHERHGVMSPIGPSARQLNGSYPYAKGKENQLQHWSRTQWLKGVPQDIKSIPFEVDYTDATADLGDRAKAYLDINCTHCHNKAGPAQASGLFLDWNNSDSTAYGFYKTPVAAGRGSGNLKFDIVPGKPNESILIYRMESLDPGIMMPELSRSLQHTEGIRLIKEWIKSMKGD